MADRVELGFLEAVTGLVPDGTSAIVAVSGGADSVALLHLMVRYADRREIPLAVAHLDHGLRRGSRTDRKFVERLADQLGLPCLADRQEVAALARRGESPEESARRVRRKFLLEARKRLRKDVIVTGHTLDDQAETVLMRLVRGAGAAALAGMAAEGPGPFVRPLLGLEREALRGWLRRKRVEWREDPSNRDLRFDRNRVRRLLVPALTEVLNAKASRHLVKAAEGLREDAQFLDALAAGLLERISDHDENGDLVLDAKALAAAPLPLATRAARQALTRAGVDPRHLSSRHIKSLMSLANGPGAKTLNLPTKVQASHHRHKIHLRKS